MAFCGLLSEYSDRIVRELHPIPYYPAPGRRRALNLYDYSIMAALLYHRSKKSQFPFDKNLPEYERFLFQRLKCFSRLTVISDDPALLQ